MHSSNQRVESGVIGMEKSSEVVHELTRSFVRDLVNKLAVIVGHCDLLSEHLKEGSQSAKHVGAIHEIAQEMAKELKEYQCRLAESARSAGFQELDVA
jgi:ubiquinone biosynthesis protein UbiJ